MFNANLSESQTVWGAFGDYIGGILGTFFNLLAIVFSIVSIYITLKIAERIHEIESKNITDNIQREKEKNEKEIELIQKQNKPFPHLDYNKYPTRLDIILSNQGPGAMIITNWEIICENKIYLQFGHLLSSRLSDPQYNKFYVSYERLSKHVISSGSSTRLLEIVKEDKDPIKLFERFMTESKQIISTCKVKIYYEDIFENKFVSEEDLSI
jgi:hypothetical protein